MVRTLLHSFDVTGDGQRFLLLLQPRSEEASASKRTCFTTGPAA